MSMTRSGTWSDIDPFELLKIVADVLDYNLMLTTTMMMIPMTMVTMRMIAISYLKDDYVNITTLRMITNCSC